MTSSFRRKRTNTDDYRKEVFEAAKSGDSVLLNEVLKKLDNTERISDDFGFTPLMAAVDSQFLAAVTFLIDQGADVIYMTAVALQHFTMPLKLVLIL